MSSATATPAALRGISSMATRSVLQALAHDWAQHGGAPLHLESVGGVEAARRVRTGEVFDMVFLAIPELAALESEGQLRAGSVVPLVRSSVAVAVPAAAPVPDLSSEAAVRAAVLAAPSIGYSTGPSGTALRALFQRWGLLETLQARLVQAPVGVAVGSLVAQGLVALGFQQRSELLGVPGITLVGDLPAAIAITTEFGAGIGAHCPQPDLARGVLEFLNAPAAAAAKRQHGMEPA